MELTHDWRGFQSLFLSSKNSTTAADLHPIYLILNGKVIVSAFSEQDDLSDWLGATEDELRVALPEREVVVFEKSKVDGWLTDSLELNHFYDQTQLLRSKAKPVLTKMKKTPKTEAIHYGHFLLHGVQTWWRRFFPSTYAVYLQVEGSDAPSLLMVVQRGLIRSFHAPDLSSLPPERRKQPTPIIKYLSERHLMPVQGIFVTLEEWKLWSESENPWPQIFATLRSNRNKLVPFKFSLVSLIASRAYLNI